MVYLLSSCLGKESKEVLLAIFSCVCLRFTHKYLLRHFPINTRFEQFHDSLHPIFYYLQQNVYFLIGITETHQGFHVTLKIQSAFSESVPGKHFRVWWCPMEKDLQKSPG